MSQVDPTLVRDVVVVLPGIMGTSLLDHEGRPVWNVGPRALVRGIATLGGSLKRLQLPDGIEDQHPSDLVPDDVTLRVRPGRPLRSLHVIPGLWSPVTGYFGLLNYLRGNRFHFIDDEPDRPGNLIEFGYDWRLSNRYNARRLARVAGDALDRWRAQPGMADAKLVLIGHSMGGLVSRWFVEQEGGAEITRAVVTIGTPHRGSAKAVETLVNGMRPGLGPLRVNMDGFVRSLPSLYQLLPTYDCVATGDGRVPLARAGFTALDDAMLADAATFHDTLARPRAEGVELHKVVGHRQPTATIATATAAGVELSDLIDERNQGGDGTVPIMAAQPTEGRDTNVHWVVGQHGELQDARSVWHHLDGLLTSRELIWQGGPDREGLGVAMPELLTVAEQAVVRVDDPTESRLRVVVRDEADEQVGPSVIIGRDGTARLPTLSAGGYTATVEASTPTGPNPVTHPFLVWDPAQPPLDVAAMSPVAPPVG